ncbi:MAG: hypothetical protein NVSMB47_18690 [Polyangiales bacterium]
MGAAESIPTSLAGGRYLLYDELASGGMASVHLGRLIGTAGFARTVAIKRMHPQLAKDPEFVCMFIDEARLAARVRHPNVISTLDVVASADEVFLVMDYVAGESLSALLRAARQSGAPIPLPILGSIISDVLHGLHAAHDATDERGAALGIVHRDVSPHNVMVGRDGVARVFDFGVAKAASRLQSTQQGRVKGKLSYMSPEQLEQKPLDRRADVFAAAIVLWEALVGRRLFTGDDPGTTIAAVLHAPIAPPSTHVPALPVGLDEVVMKGLARDRAARWGSAREMAEALECVLHPARAQAVGAWVESAANEVLLRRAQRIAEIESGKSDVSANVPRAPNDPTAATLQLGASPARSPAPTPSRTSAAADPVSGVSEGSAVHATAARARWRRPLLVGAAVALLGAVTIVGVSVARRSGTVTGAAEPSALAPSAPPSSLHAPGPSASASVPSTSASASGSANAPSSSAAPKHPVPRPTPKKPAPKESCNPPFTIDPEGVQHFKPQCI